MEPFRYRQNALGTPELLRFRRYRRGTTYLGVAFVLAVLLGLLAFGAFAWLVHQQGFRVRLLMAAKHLGCKVNHLHSLQKFHSSVS